MADAAVVNASPLLVLSRSKRLPLLKLLGDQLVVPDAVAAELRAHSDEAARAMEHSMTHSDFTLLGNVARVSQRKMIATSASYSRYARIASS